LRLIDVGSGPPVVLVPGVQGRWEWMRPAVEALARRCRVIAFSLADEPSCAGHFDHADGFACYVEQIAEALDQAGLRQASICGVSYGGLIAAAFAARHPDRVSGLILVSAIPPSWMPNARVRFYLRAPRLLAPLFVVNSLRMYPEIAAAAPDRIASLRVAGRHALNVVTHMMSPSRMARRVHLLGSLDLGRELRTVSVPTLVLTGEARLDNVVPVRLTEEYLHLWPHAERLTLERTGHLGLITRPDRFADAVAPFVARTAPALASEPEPAGKDRAGRRRVG
jgi:pimeloyl-ACP methyl ester carboxylesterase